MGSSCGYGSGHTLPSYRERQDPLRLRSRSGALPVHFFVLNTAHNVHGSKTVEAARNEGFLVVRRKLVASKLLMDESIVRLVLVDAFTA